MKCTKCMQENPPGQVQCMKCQAPLPGTTGEEATRLSGGRDSDFQFHRGQVINGRYTVLDLIGRGGMGCIYKVHDNVLGEDLALKTLLPQFLRDKLVVERFFNEARIARRLAHPNIVRVHDIGSAGRGVYISMEYVQGDSLRGILEGLPPGKRLPVPEVLRVIEDLCTALEYAHQYTVHRDIKPENIMIDQQSRIKLMDFGISKLMDNTQMTGASVVMGTPYYMSPEQLRNSREVDARADIYSVGVVLYELLTGNMPTGVPRPASQILREIPPAMDDIVARCVDPDREKRFQSAGELKEAIHEIHELVNKGQDLNKDLVKRRRHLDRGGGLPWRRIAGVGLALLCIALLVGGGGWAVSHLQRNTGTPVSSVTITPGSSMAIFQECVTRLRSNAELISHGNLDTRRIFESAEKDWADALAAFSQGSPQGETLGEKAVQEYLAVLLVREGQVFVPAGSVVIDGAVVQVAPFLIDMSEVTIGEFSEFARMVEEGWRFPTELEAVREVSSGYPMTFVSFFDALAYATFKGKALPTREQWARAAYGGQGASDTYPWGSQWQDDACNCQSEMTEPVRSHEKDRSWAGCYDMAGNVSEWTATCPDAETGGRPVDFGDALVVCGGSFLSGAAPLNSMQMKPYAMRAAEIGFRCVTPLKATLEDVNIALSRER